MLSIFILEPAEEYARQFGNKIVSAEIPVDKIIAVNVGTRGKYHELIVES